MRTLNLSHHQPPAPDTFLLYPDNRRFLRGDSQRLHGKYERRAVGLCLGLLVCALLAWMWTDQLSEWSRLTYQGRDTTGVVTGHERRSGRRSTSYYLLYRFELPNPAGVLQVDARASVSRATYGAYAPGARVRVRYLPGAPQISSVEWTPDPPVWTALGLAVAALGACCAAVFMVDAVRTLRLLGRAGQILPGRVTYARIIPSRSGDRLSISYRFVTPDQQVLNDQDERVRVELHGLKPQPGTPIAVVYASPKAYQIL